MNSETRQKQLLAIMAADEDIECELDFSDCRNYLEISEATRVLMHDNGGNCEKDSYKAQLLEMACALSAFQAYDEALNDDKTSL